MHKYTSYARMEECSAAVLYWKKQKRLYGTGCVVGILERLAGEDAKRLVEIKGPHAFLCYV